MRQQLEGSSSGEGGFDFGGTATQEFAAVDGLSNQVMASNLSALSCSLAEGVTRRSTVDDSANILTRYTSTFSTGSLRASMSDFDSGMVTGPSYDFGGTALQVVIRVNWLSSTVTGLCDRQWRCGREDILGAFDGTTSPEGLRASMSGWIQEADDNER